MAMKSAPSLQIWIRIQQRKYGSKWVEYILKTRQSDVESIIRFWNDNHNCKSDGTQTHTFETSSKTAHDVSHTHTICHMSHVKNSHRPHCQLDPRDSNCRRSVYRWRMWKKIYRLTFREASTLLARSSPRPRAHWRNRRLRDIDTARRAKRKSPLSDIHKHVYTGSCWCRWCCTCGGSVEECWSCWRWVVGRWRDDTYEAEMHARFRGCLGFSMVFCDWVCRGNVSECWILLTEKNNNFVSICDVLKLNDSIVNCWYFK